jgi:hypothetical protein
MGDKGYNTDKGYNMQIFVCGGLVAFQPETFSTASKRISTGGANRARLST